MYPGTGYLIKCPQCGNLHARMAAGGGDTFGQAQFWTDGFIMTGPTPVMDPPIIRCRYNIRRGYCQKIFWKADAEVQAEVDSPGWKTEFDSPEEKATYEIWTRVVARHETVQADDYYAALDQMVCGEDLAKWRILRTTTWHALNHPAREFKDLNFPIGTQTQLSGRARRNLEALAALLDEQQPQDRLTKAEVLRELSHFKEALQLLQHPWGTTQQQTAAIITQLATHGDALVREVIFDTRPRKAGR